MVRPDGRRRHVEAAGDLRCAEPVADQLENLLLARAQQGALSHPPAADLRGDDGLNLVAERGTAAGNAMDGGAERVGGHASREHAGGTVTEQVPRLGSGLPVQQDHARGEPLAGDGGEHSAAVEARQLAGDESNARRELANRRHDTAPVGRLGDELQLDVLADQASEAVTEERLSIGDDHGDHATKR